MKIKNLKFAVSALAAQLLFSCNTPDSIENSSSTDVLLESALDVSSNGIGKSFYIMPQSNDFQNIPQDPLNPLSTEKVKLGQLLFHETGLAQNPQLRIGMNTYSCASCHHAQAGFQSCLPQGFGEGGTGFGQLGEGRKKNTLYSANNIDVQPIRTPSAMNGAYQSVMLWNGQFGGTDLNSGTEANWKEPGHPINTNHLGFEGLETQAIAGRDVHRLLIDKIFMSNVGNYKELYTSAFDEESFEDPKKLKLNGALAIAAYERTLLANQSPFQLWLNGSYGAMSEDEKQGALLFFGKGNCASCHNGPSLANMEFHAIGMNDLYMGSFGENEVFNVNANNIENKGRGGFTGMAADEYKFKVPQLYNLKDSPFYGHGSSFTSIKDVIDYKNEGIAENALVPKGQLASEFQALGLTEEEVNQLTLFIESGLRDPNLERYAPARLPSGLAFPDNDEQSRTDLGF